MGEGKENSVMMLLILTNLLPTIMAEMTTDPVPLYSDCRFWVDPATHMRHLRQQMASFIGKFANSMNNNCFISSERARNEPRCLVLVEHQDRPVHCLPALLPAGDGERQKRIFSKCIAILSNMFSFHKTAVPCHFLTDTVCIHEDEMSQFLAERQGYYYARPDYHDNEEAGDQEGQEAVMVYNSHTDREAERPDIFGKKQYHRVSHSSDSLTSQIVKKRLNETGQLNKLEKVHSLQSLGSGSSDYGKPTFYSRRGEEVTSNEARDARPVMEVAKVFLGDRLAGSWTSGDKQSRYSNFQNIKQILQGSNSIDQNQDHKLDAFKIDTDYKDISFVSPVHYPGERGTTRGAATMSGHDDDWDTGDSVTTVRDSQAVLTTVYGFGIQHLETETSLVTPSGPGDEAIREIVHLLEETG